MVEAQCLATPKSGSPPKSLQDLTGLSLASGAPPPSYAPAHCTESQKIPLEMHAGSAVELPCLTMLMHTRTHTHTRTLRKPKMARASHGKPLGLSAGRHHTQNVGLACKRTDVQRFSLLRNPTIEHISCAPAETPIVCTLVQKIWSNLQNRLDG